MKTGLRKMCRGAFNDFVPENRRTGGMLASIPD